jgi:ssDNA-binding Zn-finger/Zn-ribbon topoisomerase 1
MSRGSSYSEVHCPKCGEFRATVRKHDKACPQCGDPQVIILAWLPPLTRYINRIADMQE